MRDNSDISQKDRTDSFYGQALSSCNSNCTNIPSKEVNDNFAEFDSGKALALDPDKVYLLKPNQAISYETNQKLKEYLELVSKKMGIRFIVLPDCLDIVSEKNLNSAISLEDSSDVIRIVDIMVEQNRDPASRARQALQATSNVTAKGSR